MAQDIIISNNQWSGVPFVDFDKVGGGTATYFDSRTVTYNLSGGASVSANPPNAIAGQGFSVKLKAPAGYNLNGVTVTMGGVDITSQVFTPETGGGGGGGGSAQIKTGTFTGDGTVTVQIPCDFVPDFIYVYGDLSGDVSLRGVVSLIFIKDTAIFHTADTSTSASTDYANIIQNGDVSDYTFNSSYTHATYANGVLTIDCVQNTSSCRFASGITYTYKFVKWTT